MLRACLAIVLVAFVGCRGDRQPHSSTKSRAQPTLAGSADSTLAGSADPTLAGSAAPGSAPRRANDPWTPDPWAIAATPDNPDDPPSLSERHRLAEQACPTVKAPYFFRIEKSGKVSHILGSRHISVPLSKFPQRVTDALAAAKLAVFEVAPDDHGSSSGKDVSIPDVLGPDLWAHYRELVGSATAEGLAKATPAEALLAMMVMYEDIGAMLDLEIERQVQEAHIPAAGLETAAFQDGLLEKLLDARALKAAVGHTKNRQELADDSKKDLGEYCAGTDDTPGMDPDQRADMLDAGYTKAELDAIDEQMVFARNASWIPKLEQMFARGDVFVVVGADHLSGPRGVVALLAKRGFTVTRE